MTKTDQLLAVRFEEHIRIDKHSAISKHLDFRRHSSDSVKEKILRKKSYSEKQAVNQECSV